MKQKFERNIKILNLQALFSVALFFIPIFVPYLISHGLSVGETFRLEAIFSVAMIIFEIPAGYFSDYFGRKKTLILSFLCLCFAVAFYGIGNSFLDFTIAEIVWALGAALKSGTDSAMYYDSLLELGKVKTFKKVYGNSIFLNLVGLSLANLIGGFLGKINLQLPFIFSFVAFFLGAIFCLFLHEPKKHGEKFQTSIEEFKIAFKNIFIDSKILKFQLIFAVSIGAFAFISFWFDQPFLLEIGLPIEYFGVILAISKIISGFTAKYAQELEDKLGETNFIISLPIILILGFTGFAFFHNFFGIIFLMFGGIAFNLSITWLNEKINEKVSSKIRASALSIASFTQRLIFTFFITFISFLVDGRGIKIAAIYSIFVVIAFSIYLIRKILVIKK